MAKSFNRVSNETIEYVKQQPLIAFYDSSPQVRKIVGSIMSTMVVKGGFYIWPNLIEFLTSNLTHQDVTVIENSILALSIIVEDSQSLFDDERFYKIIAKLVQPLF